MHRLFCLAALLMAMPAFANVVGSDAQNFNPTTSGLDFITVQSSSTLEPGVFNLGLFTNYAQNPLPYYDKETKRNSSLTGGDLNFGLGLMKGWDFGLSFPFILNQKVDLDSSVGHYSTTGNTEIRANTKFRLLGHQLEGLALIASANFNRITDNPYTGKGKGGGPTLNLEMAYKTTLGSFAWGLNLGHRWRKPGEPVENSGIDPLTDQWLASTALSYLVESIDSKIVLEVFSAFPKHKKSQNLTDRQNSVLEALLGIKYDNSTNFSFHFGGGGGLTKGTSSPDYRVYAGINISFGSVKERPSSQNDPYAMPRPKKRIVKTKPAPPPPPPPPTTPKVAKAPPPPPPVDEPEEDDAPKEVPPAVSSEVVSDVKVFNRGTYNHIVLQNIEFVGNTMTLNPQSLKYLVNEVSPAIREMHRRRPINTIVIEGHTDSLGDKAFAAQLSKARAQIVSALLRQRLGLNIPIQAVGAGSSSPIADNGNYQGRAQNQRVEIRLLYQSPR